MKLKNSTAVLGLLTIGLGPGFGQVFTVYDNGVSSVNNGRVNDMNYPSFDMHADDFALSASAVINQVSWLGGYKNGDLLPDADDGFTIQLFAFSAGTPAASPFDTFVVGAVPRQLTSQTLLSGSPIFSYSAQIPDTQLAAGMYLISIMNQHTGTKLWFWADLDSSAGDSYAMYSQGGPWYEYHGGGVAEFAFAISTVPEPSRAILFGLGVLLCGTLGARQRWRLGS